MSLSPSKLAENSIDEPLDDNLPEEIHTSLFLQSNNTDYKVVIRPPSVEYNIPAKNFLFIKTLTRSELSEFYQEQFLTWQQLSIGCLT